ncbi:MAG: HAMP domain-containing protein [Candidatus Methanomarinus sp.]|uniref:HAMP domain-containing protein n=1 Tax=Candidatus Methanomarinus sp. TaxID=3386244 RepID=A0AC61SAK6_9EURY|nr:Signal transduction histidine kinase [ANME-2 cluster archaeon]TKY91567.1 MAG: HAMP domain-containing protein [ANME-2 cluster archaeon]
MDNLVGATENTGQAIDNWMDVKKSDIRVISQSGMVESIEKEELYGFLNNFKNDHEDVYKEFFILDLDGNIIFSTKNHTGSADNQQYFIEASNGRLYVSDVYLTEVTGSPEIIIANPIKKNNTITGIMAARVGLEQLYGIIETVDIGTLGEVFIVNNKGEIIFHENRSRILHENVKNNFAVKEVTYEKNGIAEYVNYQGEPVLGSYYWLPLYRWGLIVEMNRDEAYIEVLNLGRLTVAISLFAILGVILFTFFISRRITEPIKSLEDGAISLVEGNFQPIPISSKNEIGRLTEIFNQTAEELLEIRKRLEMKIDMTNKDLEQKNKELVIANEELKKLDVLKSDFISLVSHELRTPLSAIRTSSEFLESEENVDPGVQKEMLDNIIRNVDRQARLINDILDLTKIKAGRMEFRFEQVDFKYIAQVAIENIRPIARKNNITITEDIPDKLSTISADKEKLIIVLNNLLSNALKFTPDGGATHLSVKEYKDHIEIKVKDTGIGIEKEQFEKLFDKFYQVDNPSRRKIGGSGLGLSISSEIIKAHGSKIHVESEPGQGSTFCFRLKK